MILPENGRIVVIDDKWKEVKGLISVLSKKGYSVVYFNGDDSTLPNKPIENVRVLFLDLELEGMSSIDSKSKISRILSNLSDIIGDNLYPHIIIAWTTHNKLFESLKKEYTKLKKGPVFWIDMDKTACQANDYDLSYINEKLESALIKQNFISLIILWENIIHKSTGQTVNAICNDLYEYNDSWNKNMLKIFLKLAEANAGKNLDVKSNVDVINNSFEIINSIFFDSVEQNYASDFKCKTSLFSKGKITSDIISKINSKLIISLSDNKILKPGSVVLHKFNCEDLMFIECENRYFRSEIEDKKENKKQCSVDDLKVNSKLIDLEVSPLCDFAQNKQVYNRFLKGIMFETKYREFFNKDAAYLYFSPDFHYKKHDYFFIVDFRFLRSAIMKSPVKSKVSFRIRKNLLVDIQAKMAGHINRPGVANL